MQAYIPVFVVKERTEAHFFLLLFLLQENKKSA